MEDVENLRFSISVNVARGSEAMPLIIHELMDRFGAAARSIPEMHGRTAHALQVSVSAARYGDPIIEAEHLDDGHAFFTSYGAQEGETFVWVGLPEAAGHLCSPVVRIFWDQAEHELRVEEVPSRPALRPVRSQLTTAMKVN